MNTVKIIIMSLVWKVRSTTQNACWKVILKLSYQEWIWFTIEKWEKKEREKERNINQMETFFNQNPSITINYYLKTWNKALEQTWFIA